MQKCLLPSSVENSKSAENAVATAIYVVSEETPFDTLCFSEAKGDDYTLKAEVVEIL